MDFPNRLTPLELFYEYLKESLPSPILTLKQTKKILLRALGDYFKGNINAVDLTVIACQLYYEINEPQEVDEDRELGNILSYLSEFTYSGEEPKEPQIYDHSEGNIDKKNLKVDKYVERKAKEYYKKEKKVLEKWVG